MTTCPSTYCVELCDSHALRLSQGTVLYQPWSFRLKLSSTAYPIARLETLKSHSDQDESASSNPTAGTKRVP